MLVFGSSYNAPHTLRGLLGSTLALCLFFHCTAGAMDTVRRYEVTADDTVLELAKKFLDDPYQWPEAFAANDQNPKLFPGDVLEISQDEEGVAIHKLAASDHVTLSPAVRVGESQKSIPTVPMQIIAPFLNESRILTQPLEEDTPSVVGIEGNHLAGGAHQYIFVTGIKDSKTTEFDIVESGKAVRDDRQSTEPLGYEAKILAKARLVKRDDVSVLYVPVSYQEIKIGSKLLPSSEALMRADFVLQYPAKESAGSIVNVLNGISQIGRFSVVTVSGGEDIERRAGDLLSIYKPGATLPKSLQGKVEGLDYPLVKVGTAVVFGVYQKASFAVVVEANDFITLNSLVGSF